jgi:hypothetical protein
MKPRSDHTHTYHDWQIETYANQPKEQPVSKLDFSKPETLQTRDGRPVRIYATDGGGPKPVHGAVFDCGTWKQRDWVSNGKFFCTENDPSGSDIIPKPPRVTGWLNVYDGDPQQIVANQICTSRESAKGWAGSDCIGQVFIDAEIQP